jgi:iron complex transport system substrate-binding protein
VSEVGRIASLVPSATEIIYALGLGGRVVGVSHSCDYPADARTKTVLSRPRFVPDGLSSGAIDAAVRRTLQRFGSVYEIDADRLAGVRPDLLLTQGVCEVCAVPTHDAQAAAAQLGCCPTVLAVDAHDLVGVLTSIRAVGRAGGVPERAERLVRRIERRIAAVQGRVAGRPASRVLALEWLDPPFVPGHWVPEMVALAGGSLLRGTAGRPSFAVVGEDLAGLDPDVLIVMPCGFSLAAADTDANRYRAALRAVAPRAISAGRAFVVDASAHFSRPGPRVAEGVELLAALLHPAAFPAAALAGRAAVWT